MGRRAITQEFYDRLAEGFARHPGSNSAVAKFAGCDARTARRAWSVGWPKLGFRPIAEIEHERQQAARALLEQQQLDARAAERDAQTQLAVAAKQDAAKETATEGQIARTAKHNALALLATGANLLKAGYKISQELTAEDLAGLTPLQRVKALKTIAEFNKEAANVADASVKLERLILGKPTEGPQEHHHVHVHVPVDEMAATVDRAQRALERAKEHGIVDAEFTERETGT